MFLATLALLCTFAGAFAVPKLDLEPKVTVSGLSAGAFFSAQYQVAFSETTSGAAIFAGGPYWCSQDSLNKALTDCMAAPTLLQLAPIDAKTKAFAKAGKIDPLSNLATSRWFVFSGTSDYTVFQGVVDKLVQQLGDFGVPSSNVKYENSLDAGHGLPTLSYGVSCGSTASPFINACGYDGVGAAFAHLYGALQPRVAGAAAAAKFSALRTADYLPAGVASPGAISLADAAYVYTPAACAGGARCRLHIAFHGCKQNEAAIGDAYYRHGGYVEWAEANRIVLLFPQTVPISSGFTNPNACFEWWPYNTADFAVKNGRQMATIHNMAVALGAQASQSHTNSSNAQTSGESNAATEKPNTADDKSSSGANLHRRNNAPDDALIAPLAAGGAALIALCAVAAFVVVRRRRRSDFAQLN